MRDFAALDVRIGFKNYLLAVIIGAAVAAAIFFFGVPGVDPALWEEMAAAAGVRPAREIFPGLWRLVANQVFNIVGLKSGVSVLSVLGALAAGYSVAVLYLLFRQMLALLYRANRPYQFWYRVWAPFFAAVGALLFGLSDPMWRIARVLSADGIKFAAILTIAHLSVRWFTVGSNWRLFPAMVMMGMLSAETPFGFLVPLLFIFAYVRVWHGILDGELMEPETLPDFEDLPKWRMLFLFLGGLAVGAYVNAATFMSLGGLEANSWLEEDIYFRYAVGYARVFIDASSIIGWVLGICFGLLPFLVGMIIFPRTVRDDEAMRFNLGVGLFLIGVLGAMQSGAFLSSRFWTFTEEDVLVHSGSLLALWVACSMGALVLALAAFTFECHRTYLTEGEQAPGWLLKLTVPLLTVALVAMTLPRIPKTVETEMQRIVDAAIEEIVEECGDAKWLFTDGRFDPAIEFVAKREGKNLKPLNMMSGSSDWEVALRCRGFEKDTAEYDAAETGVSTLLRIWAGEKTEGLKDAALQLGFEFWKRERRPLPRLAGLVAREFGMSEAQAKAGIKKAEQLTQRILAVAEQADAIAPSPSLRQTLSAVNWRLARFARLRNDSDIADQLDQCNTALKQMLSAVEYERMHTFMQLTPREGLQLALKRADFREARRYSAAVLKYDEDNPEANFGMGMAALTIGRLKEAEEYLTRCLKKRPDEPAVLNNLSIICRKLQRFDEAIKYAKKAEELLPGSPEVKQTLRDALKHAP